MSTSSPAPYDFSTPLTEEEKARLNGSSNPTMSAIDMAAEEELQATHDSIEAETGDADGGQELQVGNEQVQQDGQQVETETAEVSEAEWRNQNVLDYAATYGLNEADLSRFKDQGEFERYTTDLDRYVSKLFSANDDSAGQQPNQGQQQVSSTQAQANSSAQAAHTAAAAPPIPDRPGFKNGKIDPDYFRDAYEADDPVISIAEHARTVEEQLQGLQEQNRLVLEHLALQEQQAQIREFNMAVDSFAPDFFGKTTDKNGQLVALTPEQTHRRTKILDAAVNVIMPAIARQRQMGGDQNTPPVTYEQVVRRAANLEYGNELAKLESEKKAAALKAQANRTRSASRSSSSTIVPARAREMDPVDKLINDPENIRRWEELVKEGVVRG